MKISTKLSPLERKVRALFEVHTSLLFNSILIRVQN